MAIHKLVFVVEMHNAAETLPTEPGIYFVCAHYALELGDAPRHHFEEWYWTGSEWGSYQNGPDIVPFVILFWGQKMQLKKYRTMYRDADDVIPKPKTNTRDD